MTTPLAIERVSVALDGTPVLHAVDLTVEVGGLVVLLGPNGSGKSTLVRAALGLVPLASGSIEVFGTPVARFTDHARLGYVPQRPGTVAGVPATVTEVVASGRLARRRWFRPPTAADRESVDRAIEVVGLADKRNARLSDLSGGQAQRAMIARALAGEAELLVMDEPTAGVDFAQQAALAKLVGSLIDDGTAVLLVAHELGALRDHVDRAVVLRDGRVVHDGDIAGADPFVDHEHGHHHDAEPSPPREGLSGEGVWR